MKSKKFKYLIITYLIGIAYFTLFRLVNTWAYCAAANTPPDLEGLYWKALLVGWRFDNVISCYILAAPIVFLALGDDIDDRLLTRECPLEILGKRIVGDERALHGRGFLPRRHEVVRVPLRLVT